MPFAHRNLLVVVSLGLLAACQRDDETPAPNGSPTSQAVVEALPVADPPLDRAGLLRAVAQAASDFAAGADDSQRQRTLDGRRFEVALRFGCAGGQASEATRLWSFDAPERVLRIRIEPELTASSPELSELGLEDFEAIEGFWIRRPWLLEPACPATRTGSSETQSDSTAESEAEEDRSVPAEEPQAASAGPRLGIAQFYTEEDSRALRRESRAYQATRKLAADEQPSEEGYDLVLSGRLARMSDGRVIACAGRDPERPPTCVVSVTFDGVALRRPDGELVAEWSSG